MNVTYMLGILHSIYIQNKYKNLTVHDRTSYCECHSFEKHGNMRIMATDRQPNIQILAAMCVAYEALLLSWKLRSIIIEFITTVVCRYYKQR